MAEEFAFDGQQEPERKLTLSVDVQEQGPCERHVKIEVSREDVDYYFDREYNLFGESQAIPGFRKGKAPRKLIEKRFRKDVVERVKSALIVDSLAQASEEQKITAISEPEFDVKAIIVPEEGPFIYEYNIEVRPNFDIPNWKGLKLDKLTHDFTSEEVDEAIRQIQQRYAQLQKKDGAAAKDDYIRTKLTFELDGKELSHADNEVIRVRPTLSFHDCAIKDFDKLIAGAVPGDVRKTSIKINDDVADEKLRGKTVDATFEISEVLESVVPTVEELMENLGDFESVGVFRDVVMEELKRNMDYEQRQRSRRQITAQLVGDANWELPKKMLEKQAAREIERARMELQRSGFSDEQTQQYLNTIRQNISANTAQSLREHFILEAIAESEDIKAEDRDFDIECMMIAAQTGESPRRVAKRIDNAGQWDILNNQIIERKVLQKIVDAAENVEVPYAPVQAQEEALDRSVSGDDEQLPEATEEDAKAANREATQR